MIRGTSIGIHQEWVEFGGPGDQFVANGIGILGLTPNRYGVYEYPESGFGGRLANWTPQIQVSQTPIAQIVAGPNNDGGINWATVTVGTHTAYYQGGPVVEVDVQDYAATETNLSGYSGGGFLGMGYYTENQFVGDYYYYAGAWRGSYLSGPTGRLISGHYMYETACTGANGLNGSAPCVAY